MGLVLVKNSEEQHTLIVMILIGMVTIQLAQQFDNISIGIRTTERVTRPVKAENQLLGLCLCRLCPVGLCVRHAGER